MDNLNKVEILLIEDNENDAELVVHALENNNLANNFFWVKDGDEALQFLFVTGPYSDRAVSSHPKSILLDLKLPKINGLEALKKIRKVEQTRLIPVVIFTSSKEERDIINSYELGANSYIAKPLEFEDFVKTVADIVTYWLALNRTLSQAKA